MNSVGRLPLAIVNVSVDEKSQTPLFIANPRPRFSWQVQSAVPETVQTAYRITASGDAAGAEMLWDSGRVSSANSLYVEWGGAPLCSRQQAWFKIEVWDNHGNQAATEMLQLENALLNNSEWQGKWIYYHKVSGVTSSPAGYFRKIFTVPQKVQQARLYISSLGLFEAYLNGQLVSEERFAPGWSDYRKSRQYCCYDVTNLVQTAANAFGVIVGEGWYCGYIGGRNRNTYGKYPKLLCQLELTLANGERQIIVSDDSWQVAYGAIGVSDIYDGEFYDNRFEIPAWNEAECTYDQWDQVTVEPGNDVPLALKKSPPVRVISEIKPVAVLNPKPGVYIWDFGQNITGNIKIHFKPKHSSLYSFEYAEMLDTDGLLYNLNYRGARSTDYFTGTDAEVTWAPRFTFHGFRYLKIDGFQYANQTPADMHVVAQEIHTDLPLTAKFDTKNPELNQLFSNICWGAKDNFLEIPTDCPQRDERLGWTGDACVFAATASKLMNCSSFWQKYLFDMREAQWPDGAIPLIVPNISQLPRPVPVWADSIINIPWVLYKYYGDKQILRDNFEAMTRHLEFSVRKMSEKEDNFIGDWLALSKVKTPFEYIRLVMLYFSANTVCKVAQILELKSEKIAHYAAIRDQAKRDFAQKYLVADKLTIPTQTACVLAIYFELLNSQQLKINGDYLVELIKANDYKLNTGFIGTAWLLGALTQTQHDDVAYHLLQETGYPSWLYSVEQGATTIWERWNSYSKKDGFGDVNMNSFNHYAYGAVGDWMLSRAAGLECDHTREIPLQFTCCPNRELGQVQAEILTPYGCASSAWHYDQDHVVWQLEIPANTRAQINFPDGTVKILGSGIYRFTIEANNF